MKAWTVGQHLFVAADLEAEQPWELVRSFNVFPEMAYTDPPWNKSVAAHFRRIAGDPRSVDLDFLLDRIAVAHCYVATDVWIEFASVNTPIVEAMKRHGWYEVAAYATTYERGRRPESLTLFSRDPKRRPPGEPPTPDSPFLPGHTIVHSSNPGEHVLDACTGYGLTAKAAIEARRIFVGFELTEERLDRAITFAERHEDKERLRVH